MGERFGSFNSFFLMSGDMGPWNADGRSVEAIAVVTGL